MKRILLAGLAFVALAACDSNGGGGTTPAPTDGSACSDTSTTVCSADGKSKLVCNTATKKYEATDCGADATCQVLAGVADCKGSADAAAGTDTTGSDAGTTDTATQDAAADVAKDVAADTATVDKCGIKETACINTCGQLACDVETKACQGDVDCAKLNACLSLCQQGVQPPNQPTGTTCEGNCLAAAPDESKDKLYATQGCLFDNCVECTPGTADFNTCANACVGAKCMEESLGCSGLPDCAAILKCFEDEKCSTQQCVVGCFQKGTQAGQAAAQALLLCFQGAAPSCGVTAP